MVRSIDSPDIRAGRYVKRCAVGIFFAFTCAARAASEFPLDAGEYVIRSNMVMPHLEEMRRLTVETTDCLGQDASAALFPVLRQPALRGCELGFGETKATVSRYILVCESARVATGTAELTRDRATIRGTLHIKMGGKNMTFSQHVQALRTGECKVTE